MSVSAFASAFSERLPELRERLDRVRLENGLALDRASDPDRVSVAGCGFLAAVDAVVFPGDPAATAARLHRSLDLLIDGNLVDGADLNGGWFSHFVSPDGQPLDDSEVSTIDTALLLAGHLMAAEHLKDAGGGHSYAGRVREAIAMCDLRYVVRDGLISHGFTWPGGFGGGEPTPIKWLWDDTSEGSLLYWLFGQRLLTEGHRGDWWDPKITRTDYPLFVYVYPLCFDWPGMAPEVTLQRERWRAWLFEALEHQWREHRVVGLTATDGPDGYSVDSPTLVAPVLLSALAADPELPHIDRTLAKLPPEVDPLAMNYDLERDWSSDDVLSIDLGSALLAWHRIRTNGLLV